MPKFDSDGYRIAYDDRGEGDPIFLLHGFAADRRSNWSLTGWVRTLTQAGFRVIAPDSRGHGASDKPTDPKAYKPEGIAGDVIRLMDHLGLERADLFGYSMGARNTAWLLTRHCDRISSAVIAGQGLNLLRLSDARRWEKKGYKLTSDNQNTESLAVPALTPLYRGATRLGGRAGALSACLLGSFPGLLARSFKQVDVPVLVIAGSRDKVAGSPVPLAASIPGARAVTVPGKTHITTIPDAFFKGAVLGFLGQRW
ncbi:MAG: alpha/beta hydrolase [Xanthomonadales bacterium]|nr:alpha/beta hydrolase [Xanthomonadales bacterium]